MSETVRAAVSGDLSRILAMLKRHHEAEVFPWPFDAVKLSLTVSRAIADPDQCVFVCEGGLFMGSCADSPIAPMRIACETIIRAERPGACEALLRAYEEWARSRGCISARLSSIKKHDAFARLWGRRGYAVEEMILSKNL